MFHLLLFPCFVSYPYSQQGKTYKYGTCYLNRINDNVTYQRHSSDEGTSFPLPLSLSSSVV